jgi:hypothetical protein
LRIIDEHGRTVESVSLADHERADVLAHARRAAIGGRSDIFDDQPTRRSELGENQLVGMACEAAFFKWSVGIGSGGFSAWLKAREARNRDADKGDGGADCVLDGGTLVDVKGSEVAGLLGIASALAYHLTQARDKVRDEVAYVQAITQRHDDEMLVPRVVILAGWLWGRELRGREDHRGLRGWSAKCSTIRRMDELAEHMGGTHGR